MQSCKLWATIFAKLKGEAQSRFWGFDFTETTFEFEEQGISGYLTSKWSASLPNGLQVLFRQDWLPGWGERLPTLTPSGLLKQRRGKDARREVLAPWKWWIVHCARKDKSCVRFWIYKTFASRAGFTCCIWKKKCSIKPAFSLVGTPRALYSLILE